MAAADLAPATDARAVRERVYVGMGIVLAAVAVAWLLAVRAHAGEAHPVRGTLPAVLLGVAAVVVVGGTMLAGLVTRATARLEAARDRLRRAESELVESHARYDVAITGSRDGLWDWDVRTRRVYLSPRWKEMLGLGDDAVGDRLADWRALVHPDDRPPLRRAVADYLARGTDALMLEYRLRHADGSWRWVLARGAALRDEAGRPTRMAGSHTDITDRRAAEAERLLLEQQLRQAQKMEALGTLAGGIAHDFNNILAAMLGYTELAVEDLPGDSRVRSDLVEVLRAGRRARELVAQVLAFTRQDTGRVERVDLQQVVTETLAILRASIPTAVEIVTPPPTTGLVVLASPVHMQQVIVNLCTNAEHAMRAQGGGVLGVELDAVHVGDDGAVPEVAPGEYARIRVRDTGAGMPAAVRARIFEPFFTTKAVGEGTGMGLSVVHGIVTAAGGATRVESTEGQGTTIEVYLPLAEGIVPAPPLVPPRPAPAAARILVVDDEPAIGRVMQRMLTRVGYEVTVEVDPQVAIERLRADPTRYDAVVTDQAMPGLTGDRFVEMAHAMRPDLPIVLCTGFSHALTPGHARRIGAAALLSKPVGFAELVETMGGVLGKQGTRD